MPSAGHRAWGGADPDRAGRVVLVGLRTSTGSLQDWDGGPGADHFVTATGIVNPVVSVQVGSQVSGKVAHLFADFNSVVTKGQILAQIDQQPFKARVSQARAAVKSARGNLVKAGNMARQRETSSGIDAGPRMR